MDLTTVTDVQFFLRPYNVSNPPTDAELDTALGSSHPAGSVFYIDDTDSDNTYFIIFDGTTTWFTSLMSKAL